MSKKSIIVSAFAIIALVVFLALVSRSSGAPAGTSQDAAAATKALAADQPFHDFGTISMKDGLVQYDFTITNISSSTANIAAVDTSCMCTTAYFVHADGSQEGPFGMDGMNYRYDAGDTLAPGATTTVRVVYDPAAHGPAGVGHIDRTIDLHEEGGAVLVLEIAADVTP